MDPQADNPREPVDIPARHGAAADSRPDAVAADSRPDAVVADSRSVVAVVGSHPAEGVAGNHPAVEAGNHPAVEAGDSHPDVPATGSRRLAAEEGEVVDWSSNLPQSGTAIVEMILSTSVCRFTSHSGNRTAISQTIPQRPANTR